MRNRWVMHRGHHKGDADLFQCALDHIHTHHHIDAQLAQSIGRAGLGAEIAVAMFGHRHAGSGHHESGCGRNIQCALAITAGADDVHGALRRAHGVAFGAHDGGRGRKFINRFSACAQRHQKTANLTWRCLTIEQCFKGDLRFSAGQGTVSGRSNQGLQSRCHASSFAMLRKLRSK